MRKFRKQTKDCKKKEWNGRRAISGQKCEKKGEDYAKRKREGSKRDKNERNGMEMRERVSWEF
jgi:hypothetical protein